MRAIQQEPTYREKINILVNNILRLRYCDSWEETMLEMENLYCIASSIQDEVLLDVKIDS